MFAFVIIARVIRDQQWRRNPRSIIFRMTSVSKQTNLVDEGWTYWNQNDLLLTPEEFPRSRLMLRHGRGGRLLHEKSLLLNFCSQIWIWERPGVSSRSVIINSHWMLWCPSFIPELCDKDSLLLCSCVVDNDYEKQDESTFPQRQKCLLAGPPGMKAVMWQPISGEELKWFVQDK